MNGVAKMHADEIDIDEALVGRLVATQFPEWAGLPVEVVRPFGTDNAIYRLGRGWALSQAVNALSYYTLETNAVLVREAERRLGEVLADPGPALH